MPLKIELQIALVKVEEAQHSAEAAWSTIQAAAPPGSASARGVPGRVAARIAKAVAELNAAKLMLKKESQTPQ